MTELTLLNILAWAQDPTHVCAGQPVIASSSFEELAYLLSSRKDITLTKDEIVKTFIKESRRFSACGANNSDRMGVLRKNPKTGWTYLEDLLTKK